MRISRAGNSRDGAKTEPAQPKGSAQALGLRIIEEGNLAVEQLFRHPAKATVEHTGFVTQFARQLQEHAGVCGNASTLLHTEIESVEHDALGHGVNARLRMSAMSACARSAFIASREAA